MQLNWGLLINEKVRKNKEKFNNHVSTEIGSEK